MRIITVNEDIFETGGTHGFSFEPRLLNGVVLKARDTYYKSSGHTLIFYRITYYYLLLSRKDHIFAV